VPDREGHGARPRADRLEAALMKHAREGRRLEILVVLADRAPATRGDVGRGSRRLHRASRCPETEELTASDRPRSFARGETASARSRPSEGRRGLPPWHLPCSNPRSDRGVRMSTGEDLP
jgi:hypothetical protein